MATLPAAAQPLLLRHADLLLHLAWTGVPLPVALPILAGPRADPALGAWWQAVLAGRASRGFVERWRAAPHTRLATGFLRLGLELTEVAWAQAVADVIERLEEPTRWRACHRALLRAAQALPLPPGHRALLHCPIVPSPYPKGSATLEP